MEDPLELQTVDIDLFCFSWTNLRCKAHLRSPDFSIHTFALFPYGHITLEITFCSIFRFDME